MTRVFFRAKNVVADFFKLEATGGILLVIAALLAITIANSPLFESYDQILNKLYFRIGFDDYAGSFDYEIKKSLLHWINDGFMAIFFFLVGLEIKEEVVEGELSTKERALLPALAAIGGMAIPALIYWVINKDNPANLAGWAIPTATDIAFALGILALLGSRVPISLKILLTAIAVIDDLLAIIVIALFYTDGLDKEPLMFAAFALFALFLTNRAKIDRPAPYIILGIILWTAVLKSGVHATLAGVATALFIPVNSERRPDVSPAHDLEKILHPWVAFAILPLFAFANAGVPFKGMSLGSLAEPVTLGIILGLLVGKPLGIFTTIWLAVKAKLSPMPEGVNWRQLFGMSILCGIGFTMSLFIGGLAFESVDMQASIRLGVLAGSIVSACIGFVLLRFGTKG